MKSNLAYKVLGFMTLIAAFIVTSFGRSGLFGSDSILERLLVQISVVLFSVGFFLLFAMPYKATSNSEVQLIIAWRVAVVAVICSFLSPMPLLYLVEWIFPSGIFNFVGKLLVVISTLFAIVCAGTPHAIAAHSRDSRLLNLIKKKFFFKRK